MRRERWFALAALPALLLAGDFGYWRFAVSGLRTGLERWIIQARAAGWDVRHGRITVEGWPDAAGLRIDDVTISAISSGGRDGVPRAPSRWGSDAIRLRASLMRPDVLEVTPVGLRPLELAGYPPIAVSADHVHVWLTSRAGRASHAVDADLITLTASIPGFGDVTAGHLTGHADLRPGAGHDQAAVTFSMSSGPLTLPDRVSWGLGPEIGEATMEGVLNGPTGDLWNGTLTSGLTGAANGLAARAMAWRDGGGSLELHRISIAWGPARLDATATLALDEDLQPMGAGTGKIAGYGAALDALAANAVLSRSAVKAAKAVLSLLAEAPGEGQPEEVEVPLTLQYRTLSVRQVPLARLPEVDWHGR